MSFKAARGRLGAGLLATLRLVLRLDAAGTAVLAILLVLGAALPIAFMVASSRLVGEVPAVVGAGLESDAGRSMLLTLLAVGAIYIAQQFVDQFSYFRSESLGRRVNAGLRDLMVTASLGPAGISHLEDPRNVDAISIARNPGPGMFQPGAAIVGLAGAIPQRLATIGGALIVGSFAGWLMALLLMVWAIGTAALLRWLFASLRMLIGSHADLRRALYFRDLATTPTAAKEVRVFGLARWIVDRYDVDWQRAMAPSWAERRRAGWLAITAMISVGAALALALWTVGSAGADGRLSLERTALLIQAALQTLTLHLSGNDMSAAYGAATVPQLLAFSRHAETLSVHPDLVSNGEVAGRPRCGIRFDAVSFSYPGSGEPVLAGLNLAIPAGQRLAIVGSNGAGKSTMVKLLSGLYAPNSGRITIDGIDLAAINPQAWQRQVSVLFQDYLRYELTAAENVGFGAVHAEAFTDRVALGTAARLAGAHDLVAHLGHGWDTVLTRTQEGGAELSGGQWQRIALARALVAVDAGARLLILDEPTANLDVRAESAVYGELLEALRDTPVTTILISHRFSSVRRADRIVVLRDGVVAEDGTHDELLALEGLYASMFRLQAARFNA